MEHWTELRSALSVARLGTVKAAAEALGVHRATVNRHIDTLESHLGLPLFQRHARGYTLTDSGRDMMEVAGRADEMFSDFAGRCMGLEEQLSGSLKVTSLPGVAHLIIPVIDQFHQKYKQIDLEFIADEQLARLEYGEAHVAIRAGTKPTTPDYVVLPFRQIHFGMYASEGYVKNNGTPAEGNYEGHHFVGPSDPLSPLPYSKWMTAEIPQDSFVLRTSNQQVIHTAVRQGLGIGFVAEHESLSPKLVEIVSPRDDWTVSLWIVTHADLRRTLKVREFIKFARDT